MYREQISIWKDVQQNYSCKCKSNQEWYVTTCPLECLVLKKMIVANAGEDA